MILQAVATESVSLRPSCVERRALGAAQARKGAESTMARRGRMCALLRVRDNVRKWNDTRVREWRWPPVVRPPAGRRSRRQRKGSRGPGRQRLRTRDEAVGCRIGIAGGCSLLEHKRRRRAIGVCAWHDATPEALRVAARGAAAVSWRVKARRIPPRRADSGRYRYRYLRRRNTDGRRWRARVAGGQHTALTARDSRECRRRVPAESAERRPIRRAAPGGAVRRTGIATGNAVGRAAVLSRVR